MPVKNWMALMRVEEETDYGCEESMKGAICQRAAD